MKAIKSYDVSKVYFARGRNLGFQVSNSEAITGRKACRGDRGMSFREFFKI